MPSDERNLCTISRQVSPCQPRELLYLYTRLGLCHSLTAEPTVLKRFFMRIYPCLMRCGFLCVKVKDFQNECFECSIAWRLAARSD